MGFTNADKREHGDLARKELQRILSDCLEKKIILHYMSNFRIGRAGYSNDSQFLAPFLVSFPNGERWILYTTTSMRSDRIKGQQWDAENIKQIVPSITKAVLCFPDGVELRDIKNFSALAERYKKKADYSAIDDILSYRQLLFAIQSVNNKMVRFKSVKANQSYIEKVVSNAEDRRMVLEPLNIKENLSEKGRLLDAYGRAFERIVANSMSSERNLMKWKGKAKTETGRDYDVFKIIVEHLKLVPDDVKSISATSDHMDIGSLPSGGYPKTDIIITAHYNDGSYNNYTVSCKRSDRDIVTVHQYTADAFSRTLNPEDEELRKLLYDFQIAGSRSGLGEEKSLLLERALAPYRTKLFLWVMGGIDGEGNPDTQWAEHILILNGRTNKLKMHSVYEYYNYLIKAGANGMFGTPFSWTYPSKQRGKYIQLKCKIV